MNLFALTEIARERQNAILTDVSSAACAEPVLRPLVARALRASGDRLFRLGVELEPRVSAASSETFRG